MIEPLSTARTKWMIYFIVFLWSWNERHSNERVLSIYGGLGRVYIIGHWRPYEMIFYEYDGQ